MYIRFKPLSLGVMRKIWCNPDKQTEGREVNTRSVLPDLQVFLVASPPGGKAWYDVIRKPGSVGAVSTGQQGWCAACLLFTTASPSSLIRLSGDWQFSPDTDLAGDPLISLSSGDSTSFHLKIDWAHLPPSPLRTKKAKKGEKKGFLL